MLRQKPRGLWRVIHEGNILTAEEPLFYSARAERQSSTLIIGHMDSLQTRYGNNSIATAFVTKGREQIKAKTVSTFQT